MNCGAQLPGTAKFCAKCGTPVESAAGDGVSSSTPVIEKLTLPDNYGVWEGQVVNGKPFGKGKVTHKNGSVVELGVDDKGQFYYLNPVEKTEDEATALLNEGAGELGADDEKAFKLISRAAELGKPSAMHFLGDLYENGVGVTQNYAKAAEWYRKAADQGEEVGQKALDRLKQEGKI